MSKAVIWEPSLVPLLLKRGARINEINNSGNTALHVACMMASKGVTDLLVKFGADLNACNRDGKTPFELLPNSASSSEETAQMIIREAVKREALGQFLCEGYRQMAQSCEKYLKFDQECHEEITRMRSERIDVEDSAVSLFDICFTNEEKLAALARNKNIVKAFETSDYLASFDIYAHDVTTKFEKAKLRADFLISIEDCLIDVLEDMLPALILQKIGAYVEDDDDLIDNTEDNTLSNDID